MTADVNVHDRSAARSAFRTVPATIANAAAFLRHSRASRSVVRNFQDRRVRQMVTHAYANVPYYRGVFDRAGVRPRQIRGAPDLYLIPVTTKGDLRAAPPGDLFACGVDPTKLITHITGGSTGEPFAIHRSWLEERTLGLIRRRTLHYYGANSRALVAVATFNHRPARNEKRAIEKMFNSLGVFRVRPLHCLVPPEDLIAQLASLSPDVIGGYAGVLDRIAGVLSASSIRIPPPLCVISGAEVLDRAAARRIAAAFRAPVYDTYGSHEFSRIAWQCRKTGEYHRSDDSVVTEILNGSRPAEPGEEGRMVGTALHSYAMPFIRFELGDMVTAGAETCGCGQPFSTLRGIRGRIVDYFTMPDGTLLHPYEIAAALKDDGMSWVARYELVQHTRNRIVLTAVPRTQPSSETIQKMRAAVATVVGPAVEFDVAIVDRIDPGETGKYRIYRSMVARD
ncbi:MAG: hypothetical protein ABI556_12765 [Gemmatimonadales bacterium]